MIEQAKAELDRIGERRRDARQLPIDCVKTVGRLLMEYDRNQLPVAEIARRVELTTKRIYQIEAEYALSPTEFDIEIIES